MPRLYQAAIGPLHTAYYQQQFERFDALGKPLPSWNWAAGCCTLGWMGLRGLWRPAAVYAAVLLALAGLWWGLDLHHLLPRAAATALALLLVLLAVLVPGLGGNALYHRAVRARTMQALTTSRTLTEAMTQLQAEAPQNARLQWATTGHALCALLVAGLAWVGSTRSVPARPPISGPTQQDTARALAALVPAAAPQTKDSTAPTVSDPVAAAAPTTSVTTAPEASHAAEATPPTTQAPASPSVPTAPASAFGTPPAERTAAAPASETVEKPAAPPSPALEPTTAPSSTTPATKAAAPSALKPADKTDASAATKTASKAAAPKAAHSDKAEKTKAEKSAVAATARASSAKTPLQPGKYYLNSGIYAQSDNARRVVRQLRGAGQPVFTQMLDTRQGEVTRIRVGPFDSRSQAEAAARQIQGLHLEAQLFRHAPD